jgi:hypothetical protein
MDEHEREQGNLEGAASAAYAQAGIAVDKAQLASTVRALRRLQPVFADPEALGACAERFADVLEELGRG